MAAPSPPSPDPADEPDRVPDQALTNFFFSLGDANDLGLDDLRFDLGPADSATGDVQATINLNASKATGVQQAPSSPEPTRSRYLIEHEIGRGGVAIVYYAHDRLLKRHVAIKVLQEKFRENANVIRRFFEEARIASRLNHHGIIPIHDLGVASNGMPFFSMRFVEGETFDLILGRRKNCLDDLSELLPIFLRICESIAYAHSRGIIHRDLKPANVILGPFGMVQIIDWGLAKVLGENELPDALTAAASAKSLIQEDLAHEQDSGATQTGTVFGTPAYLPPEQARGDIEHVDKRADVFGLGAILCEILTGSPPYRGAKTRSLIKKAARADLQDAVARLQACLAPLDMVLLAKWCLDPDPDKRPASAADVVDVLAAFVRADQRRAEQDLIRFFNLSLDLFCIASTEGYFLRLNENFARILGYTTEHLRSVPFLEFVHPDDRARTFEEAERLSHIGAPSCIQFLNRYRCANGEYRWFEWNALSVAEERALYCVARDVTEREIALAEHRQTEERLKLLIESAVEAIITINTQGIIQTINPSTERMFGYASAELLGQNVNVLMPSPHHERHDGYLSRAKSSGEGRILGKTLELVARRKSGQEFPIELSISEIFVNGEHQFSGVIRDVSLRKHLESAHNEAAQKGTLAELQAISDTAELEMGTLLAPE